MPWEYLILFTLPKSHAREVPRGGVFVPRMHLRSLKFLGMKVRSGLTQQHNVIMEACIGRYKQWRPSSFVADMHRCPFEQQDPQDLEGSPSRRYMLSRSAKNGGAPHICNICNWNGALPVEYSPHNRFR